MNTFRIDRQTWRVQAATQAEIAAAYQADHGKPPKGAIHGLCVYSSRTILIDVSLSSDAKVATVRHELIHAFCPDMTEKKVSQLERLIQEAGKFV